MSMRDAKSRQPARIRLAAAAVVLAFTASGCGGSGEFVEPEGPLAGLELQVAAKDFSEQRILARIAAYALQTLGAEAAPVDMVGSSNTRAALEAGEVDMYWEYTGTAWISYLGETKPLPDPEEQFAAVAERDLADNGIHWTAPPAWFSNTYAMAVRSDLAKKWDLKTLSDLAEFAREHPDDATFCIETEFSTRDDGWPGLIDAYSMEVAKDRVHMVDTGIIFTELAKASTCAFGDVFATDGRIKALGLTTLEDDRAFFPNYNPTPTYSSELAEEHPEIDELLARINKELTEKEILALAERADYYGDDPEEIAEDWLREKGFLD